MKEHVTMSRFRGGFGNQIFQYAFLKVYAKKYHLHVETPYWIGRYLYGFQDSYVSSKFPLLLEENESNLSKIFTEQKPKYVNVDFRGYFQFHSSHYAPYKEYIQSLFQPVGKNKYMLENGLAKIRSKGKTIVAMHLRRGDYLQYNNPVFYGPPTKWYKEWLERFWSQLDNPVLFIASDEIDRVIDDFQEYHPITSKDIFTDIQMAPFYPDHYMLSNSDILAISNSTFSFTASMLNKRAKMFLRPDIKQEKLIAFDPWSSDPLLHFKRSYY
ncbi:alpha-1,2-fucosyltransferase [Niallia sp. 01092]|uniref:alpha-1,2-fucosyltransferase n=1 Tax=unclassified Niallia TaxID=2837522 RepID=UPI003FD2605D